MTPDKIKILKDLKRDLQNNLHGNIKELVLFGSQLKDETTFESDYDVLIIVKGEKDWKLEREISDVCYGIDLRYNIITDAHVLAESELESPRGQQPVFVNAIKQGYHV